jgi:hypothetical protein
MGLEESSGVAWIGGPVYRQRGSFQKHPTCPTRPLPRQKGRHTGSNIAKTVAEIFCHYGLEKKVEYFISDNARNNSEPLGFLGTEFHFDPQRRWLRGVGHIFNLCRQAVLFGKDFDPFAREVRDLQLEELQLVKWRRRGPIGKLHNIIVYLDASPQRWETRVELQRELIGPTQPEGKKEVYEIVKGVITRWNSFDDSAARALYLRPAIDEFVQREQVGWNNYVRRTQGSGRQVARSEPSVIRDKLSSDEWAAIAQYHRILKSLKDATWLLQRSTGGTSYQLIVMTSLKHRIFSTFEIPVWQSVPSFKFHVTITWNDKQALPNKPD